MLAIDRWRNWRPSEERFDESPGCEPPKPSEPTFEGFEGSTSGQMQNFSDRPPAAPDAWLGDFNRWRAERCVSRSGYEDAGSVACMLVNFAEWCIAHDAVPARRETFEALLRDAGFPLMDGLACGLVLKVDLEAVLLPQRAPAGSGTPARATGRRNVQRGAQVLVEG